MVGLFENWKRSIDSANLLKCKFLILISSTNSQEISQKIIDQGYAQPEVLHK